MNLYDPKNYERIENIVVENNYQGILDQDGWETLDLTVNSNESKDNAKLVMQYLEDLNEDKLK